MQTRGRRLKFTAVSAIVVLALTGFSTGHGHGSRSRHSGGGGGCSSSRQDHDSSSSTSGGGGSYGSGSSGGATYGSGSTDDDSAGSAGSGGTYRSRPTHRSTSTASSGGTARPLADGTATLVSCASEKAPYATVEVRNPNGREGAFVVSVAFKDHADVTVVGGTGRVRVPAKGRASVRVPVGSAGLAGSVDHCRVEPRAVPES
ncbi:hypothetical protein [Streptomyces sp. NBC_01176]|uniref:hypothetical protein n=1 Tax=Streptomyces sp. NBC_01176 TaxID=2903760 RepID=UPI00386789C3|nr:hypothetical protein OG199_23945 [Streptomyces sp. NBC_01176]